MGEKHKEWRKSQQFYNKFSIIIPMKNADKYIENALGSIKKQDYSNYEVLVVDDHSEDSSYEKVQLFQKENEEMDIKTFNVEDGKWGPGAGRNVGLQNATGEYIVFLDADDELLPNALINIDSAIKNNDKTGVFVLGQASHLVNKRKRQLKAIENSDNKLDGETDNIEDIEEKPDILLLGHDMHYMTSDGNEKRVLKFRPKQFQGTKLFQMGINTRGNDMARLLEKGII